jgi:hypothetical protein
MMTEQYVRSLTDQQIALKIELAVKKRDQACDVIGNVLLGLTYQQDIDALVIEQDRRAAHHSTASAEGDADA